MTLRIIGIFSVILLVSPLSAQQESYSHYERPSVCEIMISVPGRPYEAEIEEAFRHKEVPERMNDHSLGVKVVKFPQKGKDLISDLALFAKQVEIAKKMVSKWFSRDKATGSMSTKLVFDRGFYNATIEDLQIANLQIRGENLLKDAGEKLIGNTYLIFDDFQYDKKYGTHKNTERNSNHSQHTSNQIDLNDKDDMEWYKETLYGSDYRLSSFSIVCTSYLFKLVWDDETAGTFYNLYYTEDGGSETGKTEAFKNDHTTFHLEFVGQASNKLTETNPNGKYTNQQLISKVCGRLLDSNVAALQHTFAPFRIKAPLISTYPLKAHIGLKEDVTPNSKYEVLLRNEDKDGHIFYTRIGIVEPIPDMIWDNRYMATEENQSDLDATYFRQVSGDELYEGLLLRELSH